MTLSLNHATGYRWNDGNRMVWRRSESEYRLAYGEKTPEIFKIKSSMKKQSHRIVRKRDIRPIRLSWKLEILFIAGFIPIIFHACIMVWKNPLDAVVMVLFQRCFLTTFKRTIRIYQHKSRHSFFSQDPKARCLHYHGFLQVFVIMDCQVPNLYRERISECVTIFRPW